MKTNPPADLTLDDIRRAARALSEHVLNTPFKQSRTLSEIAGAEVYLKFENYQFTASFKERGALVCLLALSNEERARGVIAMSAGNHAQGVAYHARRLGVPAVIVMPRFTPNVKVEHTRGFGAEVILYGGDFDEASEQARTIAAERQLSLIHPYDDLLVMAGQGTLALEMLEVQPKLDAMIIPVGGGGLLAGIASATHALKPALQLYGVQSARFPAVARTFHEQPIVSGTFTVAEGIAVRRPGSLTVPVIRRWVTEMFEVEDGEIEDAVLLLLEIEKTIVEGAGAAGLAALMKHRKLFAGKKVGLVLSGGNIDPPILSSIIRRGLVRHRRLVRLRVVTRDVPGELAHVSTCIAGAEGNIVEVRHQRSFTNLPLQSAEVEFVLQTRGRAHLKQITEALTEAGYTYDMPDRDLLRRDG